MGDEEDGSGGGWKTGSKLDELAQQGEMANEYVCVCENSSAVSSS